MDDTRDDPHGSLGDDIDWPLMARFVAGETGAGDAEAVAAWIGNDPARRTLVDSLKDSWTRAGRANRSALQPAELDAAWVQMSARLDARDRPVSIAPRYQKLGVPVRIAAGLILVAGTALIWRATQQTPRSTTVEPMAARTFATGVGQRRTISLVDGTEIVLGPATTLRIAASYDSGARSMVLEGEALFRVQHDAKRPLIVRAGGVLTEDLGTEFTIRAYDVNDTIRVFVREGSVSVRNQRADSAAHSVVHAGEVARVTLSAAPVVSSASNAEAFLAWTHEQLVFDNTPMTSVGTELERWYGVHVDIAPSIAARRLSATFGREPLAEILREISVATRTQVAQTGDRVTFSAAASARNR